jgi:hypothetical protein
VPAPPPQLFSMNTAGKLLVIFAIAAPIVLATGYLYGRATDTDLKSAAYKVRLRGCRGVCRLGSARSQRQAVAPGGAI